MEAGVGQDAEHQGIVQGLETKKCSHGGPSGPLRLFPELNAPQWEIRSHCGQPLSSGDSETALNKGRREILLDNMAPSLLLSHGQDGSITPG